MTKLIAVIILTGSVLAPQVVLANGSGLRHQVSPGTLPNGSRSRSPLAGSHMSGANAMHRGTSGNSGSGAAALGGSNAMSGSGKR